jgi:ATP-binding cassette subfamily B protein
MCSSDSFQAVIVLAQPPELAQARSAAQDIDKLLAVADNRSSGQAPFRDGSIRLSRVCYTYPYPTRLEPSLKAFHLLAPHRHLCVICGPSGSGKSTIIRIVQRVVLPSACSITLNGQDVQDLDELSYRDHISLVAQEPVLFNMSIPQNLLLRLSPS